MTMTRKDDNLLTVEQLEAIKKRHRKLTFEEIQLAAYFTLIMAKSDLEIDRELRLREFFKKKETDFRSR